MSYSDTERARAALVTELVTSGAITDPAWRAAFSAVPRHVFVPTYHRTRIDPAGAAVHEEISSGHPAWLSGVYSDEALPVRRDVGSASTSPSLMARMLDSLSVTGTERVLEIGAGTGYNTALLCERLGSARVTSVDIDHDLVEQARTHLTDSGYRPDVVCADGALGHTDRAPYDRILATCRVDTLPAAWFEQLTADGLVVAPVGTGVAVLSRTGPDPTVVTGRFASYHSYFMPLHDGARRDRLAAVARRAADESGDLTTATLSSTVYDSRDARFWLELTVPGTVRAHRGGTELIYHPDGSWARLDVEAVTQGGPRRIWSEIETSHARWERLGRPGADRIGLTRDADGQTLWLDHPEQPVVRTTPASRPAR